MLNIENDLNHRALCSMADELYSPTDCRCMNLSISFCNSTLQDVKNCAFAFIEFINSFFPAQFVTKWSFDGKNSTNTYVLKSIQTVLTHFSFSTESNVITPYVYNKKTLKEFERTIKYSCDVPWGHCSEDFWGYFSAHFLSTNMSEETLKYAILGLFDKTGMKNIGHYNSFDLRTWFSCTKHTNSDEHFYGNIQFSIGIGCVSGFAQEIADQLLLYAKKLCSLLLFANAFVNISPWPSPKRCSTYMRYFGWGQCQDTESHKLYGLSPNEWYEQYYLCGAEWGNVISPLSRTLLPNIVAEADLHPEIMAEELSDGSICISLNKPIMQTDVDDLRIVKHLLYNALFPGKSAQLSIADLLSPNHIMWKPRNDWGILPLCDSEIVIKDGILQFVHMRTGDG